MPPDNEQRVDAAIAEYLAACDAGTPPEQEAFLAKHQDLAGHLRSFLDDHTRMRRAAGAASRATVQFDPNEKRNDATATFQPHSDSSPVGAVFGYRILDELGGGGQGIVYRALQVGLNREVALKRIRAGSAAAASTLARFWTEAESLGRLRHPNIVQVYDFGREGGEPYLCMELLMGGCLAERLAKGPLQVREAAELVRTLAYAVQAAHDAGVVHRDLKPSNILFDTAGVPKLADFGLARLLDADNSRPPTEEGSILGTFPYMSPEQAVGLSATGQADIHALGVVLYESLTGKRPFDGESAKDIIAAVINHEPKPPSATRLGGCSRDLDLVCSRCLQKSPEDRYSSALSLADDLGRWLRGEPITPPSLWQRLKRWAVQKPVLAANFCALFLLYTVHLVCRYVPVGISDTGSAFHVAATVTTFVWAIGAAVSQWLIGKPRWTNIGKYGWATTQVCLLTALLWAERGPSGALVSAYPLLVAGAALSNGKTLVFWYPAILSAFGYSIIAIGAWCYRPEDQVSAFVALSFVSMLLLLALIQTLLLRGAGRR